MKNLLFYGLIIVFLFAFTAFYLHSQEMDEKVTLRSLSVDWYSYSGDGVKLQYRTFKNNPVVVYFPKSFEKKYYRFVDTPPDYAGVKSLPMLLIHLKGDDVIFVDIYTRHMRSKALITDFTQEDLESFRVQEKVGKISLKF
jgi:hypothetical protein